MEETRTRLSGTRKLIADHMRASAQLPQASGIIKLDMTRLLDLSQRLRDQGRGVSMTSLLLVALGRALAESHELNSRIVGDEIITYSEVNAGVAVADPSGLLVVVVKGVDRKDLFEIDRDFRGLMERVKTKKLTMDDITGSTVTLSNLSKEKLQAFTSLIYHDECLIVGLGGIHREPVVLEDDTIAVRSRADLVVNMNHAIVDGMPAARFLGAMQRSLEDPDACLLPGNMR